MYLNFSYFTVFLKNRNICSKIKRSKVTDYAALIIINPCIKAIQVAGSRLLSKTHYPLYILSQNDKIIADWGVMH